MDLMQKLGGRKFLMAIIVIGAAIFLEIKSDKGLQPTMAGFLVAMVGTFSVANYASTAKFLGSRGKGGDTSVHDKLDAMAQSMQGVYSPESQEAWQSLLSNVVNNTQGLKDTLAQTSTAVVNLGNLVQSKRG